MPPASSGSSAPSGSPLDQRYASGFGALPSLRVGGWLTLAFVACTVLVVTRATLWVDAETLPWFTWLDEYRWGHSIPRALVLLGQFWLTGILAGLVSCWVSLVQRRWTPVLVTFVLIVGLDVILFVLKRWSGRPAPRSGLNEVFAGGVSYPSGHAACALVACVWIVHLIAVAAPKATWLKTAYVLAWVLAITVGITTLTLGYHWIFDTIGAWLLGGALLVFARHGLIWLQAWFDRRAAEPSREGTSAA